jgi:CRP-like cAMP-binding protein
VRAIAAAPTRLDSCDDISGVESSSYTAGGAGDASAYADPEASYDVTLDNDEDDDDNRTKNNADDDNDDDDSFAGSTCFDAYEAPAPGAVYRSVARAGGRLHLEPSLSGMADDALPLPGHYAHGQAGAQTQYRSATPLSPLAGAPTRTRTTGSSGSGSTLTVPYPPPMINANATAAAAAAAAAAMSASASASGGRMSAGPNSYSFSSSVSSSFSVNLGSGSSSAAATASAAAAAAASVTTATAPAAAAVFAAPHSALGGSFPRIRAPTDVTFRPDTVTGARLRAVPILRDLSDSERAVLGAFLQERAYRPGDVVIRQGDIGDGFYIMMLGRARVHRRPLGAPSTAAAAAGADLGAVINEIGEGDYFGEAALLSNAARGASVVAACDCTVLFLHRDHFHRLFFLTDGGVSSIPFARRDVIAKKPIQALTPRPTPAVSSAASPTHGTAPLTPGAAGGAPLAGFGPGIAPSFSFAVAPAPRPLLHPPLPRVLGGGSGGGGGSGTRPPTRGSSPAPGLAGLGLGGLSLSVTPVPAPMTLSALVSDADVAAAATAAAAIAAERSAAVTPVPTASGAVTPHRRHRVITASALASAVPVSAAAAALTQTQPPRARPVAVLTLDTAFPPVPEPVPAPDSAPGSSPGSATASIAGAVVRATGGGGLVRAATALPAGSPTRVLRPLPSADAATVGVGMGDSFAAGSLLGPVPPHARLTATPSVTPSPSLGLGGHGSGSGSLTPRARPHSATGRSPGTGGRTRAILAPPPVLVGSNTAAAGTAAAAAAAAAAPGSTSGTGSVSASPVSAAGGPHSLSPQVLAPLASAPSLTTAPPTPIVSRPHTPFGAALAAAAAAGQGAAVADFMFAPADEAAFLRSAFEIREQLDSDRTKTTKVRDLLLSAIKANVLFEGMTEAHKAKVLDRMWRVTVPKGTTVITQGDIGDNFYVIEKGKVHVLISTPDGSKQRKVASLKVPGASFGELALLYDTPRVATIVAAAPSTTLWALDRIAFRRILRNVSELQLRQFSDFLAGVDLLRPMNRSERAKVAEALEVLAYTDGERIVTQGERGDAMYFICAGAVEVTRTVDGAEYVVNALAQGQYFGERCLLESETRTASVRARGHVEVAKLDRYAFQLLLGPVAVHMLAKLAIYQQQDALVAEQRRSIVTPEQRQALTSAAAGAKSSARHPLANQDPRWAGGLTDFEVIGFLGKGGYGYVELVRDRRTAETFALKTMYRSHIVATKSTHNVINERRLAARVDSPHVIRLHATFKDRKRLYFLLEPALGGELFQVLRAHSVFSEKTARFYAALVVRGLEAIHAQRIVYRDLKPENLLLDAQGYVKIADFGLSKEVPEGGRTFTVCGTPHYLAPEVIAGTGHSFAVDLWCLGVLIYEMLVGRPPFYRPHERGDQMKLFKRIYAGEFERSPLLSDDAWDVICLLLQKKPSMRLGAGGAGMKQLKAHPWFMSVDWHGLAARTVRAPLIPFIKGEDDTANFKAPASDYVNPEHDVVPTTDQAWDAEF